MQACVFTGPPRTPSIERHTELTGCIFLVPQVATPWHLTTVRSFLSAKYHQDKKALCQAALSAYLKKRMNSEHLTKALALALKHPSKEWSVQLRFTIAWACATGKRASDMQNLAWRGLSSEQFRIARNEDPWQGVGPDRCSKSRIPRSQYFVFVSRCPQRCASVSQLN